MSPASRGTPRETDDNDNYEVRFWCRKLGVSPRKFLETVRRVGSNIRDVQSALKESTSEAA